LKIGVKIFIFCLCLNCATFIVNNGGFAPLPGIVATNIDMNQTITAYNTTSFSGTPTVSTFFDIGRGIYLLGNLIVTATIGFPVLLWQLGVPWMIYLPITLLELAMIAFMFVEMWSGSTQTDVY
jgi:hypothetical protein